LLLIEPVTDAPPSKGALWQVGPSPPPAAGRRSDGTDGAGLK
jgi:hypothetical protein